MFVWLTLHCESYSLFSMKNEDNIYKSLGEKIATYRANNRLTQTELAEKVNMSRASIANIEVGRQKVFVHQIYNFASALGLTNIQELLPDVDNSSVMDSEIVISSASKLTSGEVERVRNLLKDISSKGRT